jgi:glycosyltransferase involved in cell wall biosynthesis
VKVAFHVDQLWFRVPGGIGTYVRELAPRLAAEPGVEVVPFRSSWPGDRRVSWTVPMQGITTGRHTIRYPLWDVLGWPPLPAALADCDLVHATNPSAVPPARPGQGLAVTVHDLAFERFPETFVSRWRWLYRAGVRAAIRRADAILVPSKATATDLAARFDLDGSRVVVTPLAASTDVGTSDPTETLDQLGVRRPYVLFVGTLEPRKNVARLIRAYRRVAPELPHTLVLAGPLGWKVEGIVAELGDPPGRIRHTGVVPAEQLDVLYRAADAFCYPSLYEGFGLPVLEAMQRGTPVVASTAPALAEVAGDAALLVDPTDEGSIADGLRRVLTDSSLADDLRRRGRERAANFSWDRTARATLDVYRSLIDQAS